MITPEGYLKEASDEEKEFLVVLEEFTDDQGFTCDSHHEDTLESRIEFANDYTSLLDFYKFLNARKKL